MSGVYNQRHRLSGSAYDSWPRFLASRRGNVAVMFSLMLPLLAMLGAGGIELNQVLSDKHRTQEVADSTALMGAGQLGVTPIGADQRAQNVAVSELADVARYATVTVQATVGVNATMTVAIDTQRQSFFGSLLPPGGFHTHVTATAHGVNSVPLCVLGITSLLTDLVHITGTSQLQAGQCLVHSNAALTSDAAASILAQANEATTVAAGPITAAAFSGAPNIPDPFSGMATAPSTACSGAGTPVNVSAGTTQTLAAGIHTGPITVSGGSTLTLGAGDHWFCKTVTLSGGSTASGTDVDMIFEPGAILSLSGSKTALNLSGRQSGPYAGFVLIADRTYNGTFTLQSDFITGLTGTVYVPSATLAVQGTAKSGTSSPWTVLDAEAITVDGGAQLVINANYAASSVPVPTGVGNKRSTSNVVMNQ